MTLLNNRRANRKSRVVSFRLTQAEFLRLSYRAAVTNKGINELARKLTLSRVERMTVKHSTRHDPALVQQLHYIGHNLNQMTKRFHATGHLSNSLLLLCQRIEAIVDEALAQKEGR